MNITFAKTIKFRLTLWYSLFVLLICGLFIIVLNLFVADSIHRQSRITDRKLPPRLEFLRPKLDKFSEIQLEALQEVRKDDVRNLQGLSLLAFIPLTVLSFAGGYLLAGRMLSPIQKLNEQIKQINVKNLSTRIDPNGDDEISQLIVAFNSMTDRLDSSFVLQKQFIEDASHELKTPLAIMQSNLDELKNSSAKATAEEVSRIQTSITFMNKLVEDLLLLSLTEGNIELTKKKLNKIVSTAVGHMRPLAKLSNQKIVSHLPQKVLLVKTNSAFLERAVMNIIENALKYSQQDVAVELSSKNGEAIISIKDKGKGISGEHLEKIFSRFYRVEKSRSRKQGGSGLGLAIAKKFIEVSNGSIEINSVKDLGTEVLIKIATL